MFYVTLSFEPVIFKPNHFVARQREVAVYGLVEIIPVVQEPNAFTRFSGHQ